MPSGTITRNGIWYGHRLLVQPDKPLQRHLPPIQLLGIFKLHVFPLPRRVRVNLVAAGRHAVPVHRRPPA